MINTTITVMIDSTRYEFKTELSAVADWAETPEETAIGLLFEGVEQLARALGVPRPEPQAPGEDTPLKDPEQERAAQLIAEVNSGEIKSHVANCHCPQGKVGCTR